MWDLPADPLTQGGGSSRYDQITDSSSSPLVPGVRRPLRSVDAERLKQENVELREVIRKQGEFIMSLKHQIRDFLGNA